MMGKKKVLSEGKHIYNESSFFVVSRSLYPDLLVEHHKKKKKSLYVHYVLFQTVPLQHKSCCCLMSWVLHVSQQQSSFQEEITGGRCINPLHPSNSVWDWIYKLSYFLPCTTFWRKQLHSLRCHTSAESCTYLPSSHAFAFRQGSRPAFWALGLSAVS